MVDGRDISLGMVCRIRPVAFVMNDQIASVIVQCFGLLLTSIVIPWAIMAYQRRTGVDITAQERQAVYNAADTSVGIVQKLVTQGKIHPDEVLPSNPEIVFHAQAALDTVPDAAIAQKTTPAAMARIIAARIVIPAPVLQPLPRWAPAIPPPGPLVPRQEFP